MQADGLLLAVAACRDDDPEAAWPERLAGPAALKAVRRLWDAVAPAKGDRAAASGRTGPLLAPGGRYEHQPVRLIRARTTDICLLGAVAAASGLARLLSLAPDPDTDCLAALISGSSVADITLTAAGEAAYQRYAARASTGGHPVTACTDGSTNPAGAAHVGSEHGSAQARDHSHAPLRRDTGTTVTEPGTGS